MKIEKIHIQGFSSHKDTQISFEQAVSFFLGSLGTGKSSIKQAMEIALTGSCEGYRSRNQDQKEMIHDLGGVDRFDILAELDSGPLKRGKTTTSTYLQWRGTDGTVQETERKLFEDLKTNADLLRVVFNTSGFFELGGKEQLQLILLVTGATVNDEKTRELFTGDLEAFKLLSFPIDSMEAIEAAYKHAYSERTITKRELTNLLPPSEPEGEQPPIDTIKEGIAILETQESDLTSKIGELKGRASGGAEAIQKQIDQVEQEIRTIRNQLETPAPTDEAINTLSLQLEQEKKNAAQANKEKDALEHKLTMALAELTLRKQQLVQLKNFKGNCVAADFHCPAAPADMKAAIETQEKQISGLKQVVNDLEGEIEPANPYRTHQIEQELEKMKALQKHQKTQEQSAEKAEGKLSGLMEDLEHATDEDPESDALEEERKQIRLRIAKGQGFLEEAQTWAVRKQEIERVAQQRKELEQRKTHLEQLCKFFGPKGIKVTLIQENLEKFEAAVNKYLGAFGFTIEIKADPWSITVGGRPARRLSRSEQFRLGTALQIAIAKTTGVNLVVIDNSEILTPEVRKKMIDMVTGAELDQALVFSTLMIPEDKFTKPEIENVGFYMVRNNQGVSEVQAL